MGETLKRKLRSSQITTDWTKTAKNMITFVLILSLCLGDCYSCSPNRNSILRGINEIVRSINVKEVVMKVEDTWKQLVR